MKTISTELDTHLKADVTTLATCWKLTLRNSTVMGFCNHDKDITFESVTYISSTGFTSKDLENGSDLAIDNMNIEGILDSTSITEKDIMAGLYDFAEVEIFKVNYEDLTQGKISVRKGWLGEVSVGKNSFVAEISGLTQRLTRTIGELYSPSCRANLGDSRCTLDLASYTVTGSVTGVTSNSIFDDSTRAEDNGYFNFGKITFTSGLNNGLSFEVKEFSDNSIILALPTSYDVAVSDTYTMIAGCDKVFETCKTQFNNVVNFRGEPHVPGTDKILETSGTRSE